MRFRRMVAVVAAFCLAMGMLTGMAGQASAAVVEWTYTLTFYDFSPDYNHRVDYDPCYSQPGLYESSREVYSEYTAPYWVNRVSVTCSPAPLGYYAPGDSYLYAARPGSYVGVEGAAEPTPCPVGTYQPDSGQASCLTAPPGFYVDTEGATGYVPAPPGSYVASYGASAPTPCPLGTYQPDSGQAWCLNAPPGSYVYAVGATESVLCPFGSYQPYPGQASCHEAPIGSYVDTIGATSATPCPAGTTTELLASDSIEDCVPVDTEPPVVTGSTDRPPNAAGWFDAPVTVSWTAEDDVDGALPAPPSVLLDSDGANQSATSASVCDAAGNCATGTLSGINVDLTPPSVDVSAPADGAVYGLHASVTADYSCTDNLDPSPSCTGTVGKGAAIDTSSVGEKTFTVTSTDAAGHESTVTHTYTVAFGFSGFTDPVDPDAANIVKAGQTVPLQFRLTDAHGTPITDLSSVSVSASTLICTLGTTENQLEEYAAGDSGLQNLGDGYYQYNWKTPKGYKNSCKTLSLDLGDGVLHTAEFHFTR